MPYLFFFSKLTPQTRRSAFKGFNLAINVCLKNVTKCYEPLLATDTWTAKRGFGFQRTFGKVKREKKSSTTKSVR